MKYEYGNIYQSHIDTHTHTHTRQQQLSEWNGAVHRIFRLHDMMIELQDTVKVYKKKLSAVDWSL